MKHHSQRNEVKRLLISTFPEHLITFFTPRFSLIFNSYRDGNEKELETIKVCLVCNFLGSILH
ncbi:CLUMA_CG012849, isoform A [Clunio marinus]|uniref:CLUMA_CG012849, isoform A n=1 Tax=Clunio marinus TaxID=568069 RepID=A0A1J1IIE5_9DIPT|nr:CLUMA_CG012849, isoform A [Clunio marinus]